MLYFINTTTLGNPVTPGGLDSFAVRALLKQGKRLYVSLDSSLLSFGPRQPIRASASLQQAVGATRVAPHVTGAMNCAPTAHGKSVGVRFIEPEEGRNKLSHYGLVHENHHQSCRAQLRQGI